MAASRTSNLIEKLEKGLSKSLEVFQFLEPDQWERPIFDEVDSWNAKDLVAHFIYSEEHLLGIAQDIASGGEGAPSDLDIDRYNREELERLRPIGIDDLLSLLAEVRGSTIAWVRGLDDATLDLVGRHPVLGSANIETIIHSIYAHQLLHMRETAPRLTED